MIPYASVRSDYPNHPKVLKAGLEAAVLYIGALCYANRYLTDGFIPSEAVESLWPGLKNTERLAERLVGVGLWEKSDGGFAIHDFLEMNLSAVRVKEIQDQRRQAAQKGGATRAATGARSGGRFTSQDASRAGGRAASRAPGGPGGMPHQPKTSPPTPSSSSESKATPLSGNGARRDTSKPADTEAPHEQSRLVDAVEPAVGKARDTEAREILDYLNRRTGHAYEPVESNLSLIRARLAEKGRTVQQVIAVIDSKVAKWLNDPAMSGFLRPETLFGARKFAQYVGALTQGPAESPPETPEAKYVRQRRLMTGDEVTLEQAKGILSGAAR